MRFDILTIFPKIFDSYFGESILKRAKEKGVIEIFSHGIRDYAKCNKHKKARPTRTGAWCGRCGRVDNRPFGGGAGMVMTAQPILDAVKSLKLDPSTSSGRRKRRKTKVVIMSAKGKMFNQKMAFDWSRKYDRIVMISGRYEGIDERVKTILKAEEVSIGPYVLTDGDVAAMTIVSAVARLIPGAIRLESLAEESHWNLLLKKEAQSNEKGLEYPHYTRPEIFEWKGKKFKVPKVLLGGNHAEIELWRKSKQK